ncbi:MAG TPA: DUF559 domain-containing protein [Allosphingosinicella sp.]|nr:DUF559 domain-containing protein [Allosphingosinicella sp.]
MLNGPKATIKRARKLRREMSLPEVLLWQELRRRPAGLKFRKQHPAGPYAADFFCHEARLVVEVDGEAHDRGDRPARDAGRDAWFAERRFAVMRIPAAEVLGNLEDVIQGIVARAQNPPMKGEGDHAQHGVSDSSIHSPPLTPLHPLPAAGGPPPPMGEDL